MSRLAIDSLDAFEYSGDRVKLMDYLVAMIDCLRLSNISVVLICRSLGVFFNKLGISYLTDNIITTSFVRQGNSIRKALSVLKMRGTDHDRQIKELCIGRQGIAFNWVLASEGDCFPH